MNPQTPPPALRPLPRWIFASRWLQAQLYIGLIIAQGVYVWQFWVELVHLIGITATKGTTEAEIMLVVLGLIDVVMISNLLVMVIVGGWETFVSRLELDQHPDEPEWLSHVNAGMLKVKLATAIIGISSIHLLKTFINASAYDEKNADVADHHPLRVSVVCPLHRLDRAPYRQARGGTLVQSATCSAPNTEKRNS